MAQSARIAALLEQRRALRSLPSASGKIRVLSPSSSASLNSIAKSTSQAELSSMINKYNDGQVGNDEMKTFLAKQAALTYYTPSEKADIQNQISDFDNRIKAEQLQAVYKNAPDNSLEKVQAAQALAKYFNDRAASQVAGTPAHSQNLQDAGTWTQQAQNLQDSADSMARSNMRASQEAEINKLPTGSSDRIFAKAELYKKLYDDAVAKNDVNDANKYGATYSNLITQGNETVAREQEQTVTQTAQEQKKQVVDSLNTLANDWRDGRVDSNTAMQQLAQIDANVNSLNDPGLFRSVDSFKTQLQSQIQSSVVTDFDKSGFDYSDNIRLAEAMLKAGRDGKGNPYTPQMYAQDISKSIQERATALQTQIQNVEQVAQTNPNARVTINGSKVKASDALDSLYKEQQSIGEQSKALQNGNAVLVQVPPKAGSELGSGKSQATYQFVDKNNLPKDGYAPDDQGVYHVITKKKLNDTEFATLMAAGQGKGIQTDALGNHYLTGVDIYEPGTSNKATLDYSPGKSVPSWDSYQTQLKNPAPVAKTVTPKEPPLNPVQGAIAGVGAAAGNAIKNAPGEIQNIVRNPVSEIPKIAGDVGNSVVNTLPGVAGIKLATQIAAPQIQKLNLPQIQLPQISTPRVQAPNIQQVGQAAGNAVASTINPTLGLATNLAPIVRPIAQAVSQNIPAPVKAVAANAGGAVNNALASLGGAANNALSSATNFIKGLKIPKLF